MNVLFDTNVLLDVILERQPFVVGSRRLWYWAESGKLRGWVSVLSFSNIYYIVRKARDAEIAAEVLIALRDSFELVACNAQIINQAIDAKFRDFEDAIQYFSALHADAACILTRNPDHFLAAELPILSPAEFLASHSFE